MLHLSVCPLCLGNQFSAHLSCKDYTVSHETFQIQKCEKCGFLLTNPQPDEKEIDRYYQSEAYISHSDKPSNLIDQVYKISRKYTLKWKYNLIKRHSLNELNSVLDYGCGTGTFLSKCKAQNLQVQGVEPSAPARAIARSQTQTEVFSRLTQVKLKSDAITLWHVLEHVAEIHETIEGLKSVLNENGTMFIAVPNHESLDAEKYGPHWAGYDVPRHLWHFSRVTMEKLLRQHHLNVVAVVPMRLDAYYVSLLSEKYKNGKSGISQMTTAVVQGWKSNHAAKTTQEFSSLIYIARK